MVAIVQRSRLAFGSLLKDGETVYWDTLDLPAIEPQAGDMVHMVQSTDRIDLLAYKYYGDSVLWWVIALANGMELVPNALHPGENIRIPDPNYVLQTLFSGIVK